MELGFNFPTLDRGVEPWLHEGELLHHHRDLPLRGPGGQGALLPSHDDHDRLQENVHELDQKRMKERTVVHIDIANDSVATADYKVGLSYLELVDNIRIANLGHLRFYLCFPYNTCVPKS